MGVGMRSICSALERKECERVFTPTCTYGSRAHELEGLQVRYMRVVSGPVGKDEQMRGSL